MCVEKVLAIPTAHFAGKFETARTWNWDNPFNHLISKSKDGRQEICTNQVRKGGVNHDAPTPVIAA
jgi:hypothetical protein